MDDLRKEWSQLYGTPLTDTDIKAISDALSGFFSLIKAWDKDKGGGEDGKNNGSNVPPYGA